MQEEKRNILQFSQWYVAFSMSQLLDLVNPPVLKSTKTEHHIFTLKNLTKPKS
jgi:hypothetical protein